MSGIPSHFPVKIVYPHCIFITQRLLEGFTKFSLSELGFKWDGNCPESENERFDNNLCHLNIVLQPPPMHVTREGIGLDINLDILISILISEMPQNIESTSITDILVYFYMSLPYRSQSFPQNLSDSVQNSQ